MCLYANGATVCYMLLEKLFVYIHTNVAAMCLYSFGGAVYVHSYAAAV